MYIYMKVYLIYCDLHPGCLLAFSCMAVTFTHTIAWHNIYSKNICACKLGH